ncbi:alpha/beta hydrolase [Streptomyces meridianus]|uniref:Alpha/beta hydrolase n=1 Tax=Streptomyces meridianus TaxID=2938945 RepID=A0ABT0X0T7_9ACTN|nr:alpha/beta hydrolase [Streptomyces meridianus]MCM2576166.1 alpha/beta hydrolase [Streptomyces meridianus]
MPPGSRPARAVALTAATALAAAVIGGCTGGGDEPTGSASRPEASAATGPVPALPGSLTGQRLRWKPCGPPTVLQGDTGTGAPQPLQGTRWECTSMRAPLDYARPDGRTIDLALIRVKADPKDGEKRIGSLIFNFGGPGSSGVATLPAFAEEDYRQLHTRYDLVSFDPRGIGASAPVRCLDDKQLDAWNASDGTPDDRAEEKAYVRDVARAAAACAKNSGTHLPYLGTVNAARDLDLMRQVLGDDELHYFGISYGTELGGVYAHLYPKRVGRAVLDAVVDPTQAPEEGSLAQAKGFQQALDAFLEDCAGQGSSCPVGKDPEEGEQKITQLLDRLDEEPLPTNSGRDLTQTLAMNGILQALYSKDLWPVLRQALQEARQYDSGSLLLVLSDALTGRDEEGRYNNSQAAHSAVVCADTERRYTAKDVEDALPEFRKASPVFGELLAWGLLQCTDWPVAGQQGSTEVGAEGSAPILVVGNTGDPATPFGGTGKMLEELGPGVGVELIWKGQGHGAYGSSRCVEDKVNGYLLDGRVPANGTVCP